MHSKTIITLSQDLHKRKVSSMELTEHFLNRIKNLDPILNCFITVNEEQAVKQAKIADKILAKNKATSLTGIPIAHKDIFCTEGIKTSCASKMLDNFIAPYDATVVERLKASGTVLIGKTNMDEFAMGSSNENSYYGPTKNPWNINHTPGGSSGGSAAAVAARIIPVATGSDTGGSIRQPAAFCGVTGLKPTYGRVSRYGMIAFASSLDQGGLLTQTAEDAALLLNVIASYDNKDSTSIKRETPNYLSTLRQPLKDLKIGLPREYFSGDLEMDIMQSIEAVKEEFEKMGAILLDINLPHTNYAIPVYHILASAECSSNLSRYDGIRYGYRCANPIDLEDLYKRSRTEGLGSEVKCRIIIGTYVLSERHYSAYYLKAQKVRRLIKNDFIKAFKKVHAILTPATPTTAFKLGEKTKEPIAMYLSDIYTIAVNLAGLPAVVFPSGFTNQLPIGVQLIGNYFEESLLLRMVYQYQQRTDWHKKLPNEFI
ncbi:Asp-tRNA(Asn)/Glu-tRNA(Gln) amidotransferase subunit GatA [Coxiella endosymbiont of Amblyomma americanum]|uniref:Asp-tRNA(Asn)/Glu-tRNA(Gln) amidotransferase subunit GatA n=1 Tax=Coxiella endosymbiont of Amblyomma americanum TaxID=325775 RepID=UPI00057CAD7F|nr:Asp-tRNA(Asn)/Glu-tRNA(Gln) amidotransferase subunit GatA [Coxiella endosymbiont of Amblyomma americanum]AJC50259.1 glutamyl-tRNA amidotransferase [Coxiella endosymbiont of Amblyomma americanum]AUJ58616.1 aspartyl/glutamyl-tRNA amidotransferase subunit A [Coxiella-like endosymbiont of Amblyomma americanum]